MRATIQMIAEQAGVSRGTVDRVINNRPNVKPEVRQRILKVMQEFNYTPNKAARALALNKNSRTTGIILPSWSGFFKSEISRGIMDATKELRDYGIEVLIVECKTEIPDECIAKISELEERGISGLCLCAKNHITLREKIEQLANKGIPTITYNSDIRDSKRLCFVGQDVVRSGRIAAEIMTKCIRKDSSILIVVGNMEFSAHRQRVDGFCRRMEERQFDLSRISIVESYNEYAITFEEVASALRGNRNLKGIYMANESVPGCVEAIQQAGMSQHIHVICHDISESTKQFLADGSVDFAIEQDIYWQGYRPLMLLRNVIIDQKYPSESLEYTRVNIINAENMY